MLRERISPDGLSDFLKYLAALSPLDDGKLPSLTDLSQQLGVSVASLREQLEVARALGLVEVRPKTGIRRLSYTFRPAVRLSLAYSVSIDPKSFQDFADLRNHIEAAYFYQAVSVLTPQDHQYLSGLIECAEQKLHGHPVQIPHDEHRELHLSIYRRLGNPFVLGMLEAYWESYEAVGLNVYTDITYLDQVWKYHRKMVEAICVGDHSSAYRALVDHNDLLNRRPRPVSKQKFE